MTNNWNRKKKSLLFENFIKFDKFQQFPILLTKFTAGPMFFQNGKDHIAVKLIMLSQVNSSPQDKFVYYIDY